MSEALPAFRLLRPATLEALVAARAAHDGARLVAGGTDLLPNMRRGLIDAGVLIDVTACGELSGIAGDGGGLVLGAATTLADVAGDARVRSLFPALAEAAGSVAGPTQRGMATVGGNVCLDTRCIYYNQSEWWRRSNDYCLKHRGTVCHVVPTSARCRAAYSGDLAAALLLYDASVDIAGPGGVRRAALDALFVDDGKAYLALEDDEVLARVRVPARFAGLRAVYRKLRVRGSIDFPLAAAAVGVAAGGGVPRTLRLGLTGTDSRPLSIDATREFAGRPFDDAAAAALERLVAKRIDPVRTSLAQPRYRRRALAALAAAAVRELCGGG